MAEIFTEYQKLLIEYLAALKCDKVAAMAIVFELEEEEEVIEMLKFCHENHGASTRELLDKSSEIYSRYRSVVVG